MSRQDQEQRRELVRLVVSALIDHPKWRDGRIARELGLDEALIGEIREFALSYPPTVGVKPEPSEEDAESS